MLAQDFDAMKVGEIQLFFFYLTTQGLRSAFIYSFGDLRVGRRVSKTRQGTSGVDGGETGKETRLQGGIPT